MMAKEFSNKRVVKEEHVFSSISLFGLIWCLLICERSKIRDEKTGTVNTC